MTRRLGSKLRATAYHEAGHAIIGMAFGRGIAFIRLIPPEDRTDGLLGRTGFEAEDVIVPSRIADLGSIAADIVEFNRGDVSVAHFNEVVADNCSNHRDSADQVPDCEAWPIVREAQALVAEHAADIERLATAVLADYRAGGTGLVNLRPVDWITGWSVKDDQATESRRRSVQALIRSMA